jgi:predicted DNA binding CopG/RHH family protein
MRTTVRLSDDLLRRARKKAAEQGRALTSLLEEGFLKKV